MTQLHVPYLIVLSSGAQCQVCSRLHAMAFSYTLGSLRAVFLLKPSGAKVPLVVLVNALYGLDQVLISLDCTENHNCYLNKWFTRQTKWYPPLQKGLARTLFEGISKEPLKCFTYFRTSEGAVVQIDFPFHYRQPV